MSKDIIYSNVEEIENIVAEYKKAYKRLDEILKEMRDICYKQLNKNENYKEC